MDFKGIPEDLIGELKKFDVVATETVNAFTKKIDSQEPPNLIYHYTTGGGLGGILESGQLWLTDIFNLNDPSELRHGISHALEMLNSKVEGGPPDIQTFVEIFRKFSEEGADRIAHLFVCCFSKCGDELGQWRAYADNGRGYVLAFDAKCMEEAFVKEDKDQAATFPVSYNNQELVDIHNKLIEIMSVFLSPPRERGHSNLVINIYLRRLVTYLAVAIAQTAFYFKHAAYKNEQEYRFLQMFPVNVDAPGVKRRYRSYEAVMYREYDWRRLCPEALKKIIVGPAADRPKATRFAAECLNAFHVGTVEIVQSEIPYRTV